MFNHQSIRWIKNVKRDHGNAWAYMEYEAGEVFDLNFSTKWGETNAERPEIGEVIAIFQTINKGHGVKPGTYFTHLVTPLDSQVKRVRSTHPIARFVGVLAKPIAPIPVIPLGFNMRKPGYGSLCSVDLITNKKHWPSLNLNRKQTLIWNAFSPNITKEIESFLSNVASAPDEDEGVLEGELRRKMREHKYYERSPEIVRKAKALAIKEGRLKCEVCTFDFAYHFPKLGSEFIECHHRIPIGTGIVRRTRVKDLALVCGNCHRMLHRKYQGQFLTVKELQKLRII